MQDTRQRSQSNDWRGEVWIPSTRGPRLTRVPSSAFISLYGSARSWTIVFFFFCYVDSNSDLGPGSGGSIGFRNSRRSMASRGLSKKKSGMEPMASRFKAAPRKAEGVAIATPRGALLPGTQIIQLHRLLIRLLVHLARHCEETLTANYNTA